MLADDHMLMRMGLSTLVACEEDMKIVGEARNGRQAVELALALKPDIIIMDLMMPELSGAEATKLIHEACPEIKIMVLTSFGTSKEMSDAITNGADGALMKDTAANDLIEAIRAIMAGKRPGKTHAAGRGGQFDAESLPASSRHPRLRRAGPVQLRHRQAVRRFRSRHQEAAVGHLRAPRRDEPRRGRRPRPPQADAQGLTPAAHLLKEVSPPAPPH